MDPVPGAIKFINELLERVSWKLMINDEHRFQGKQVYIVTNNSTKTITQYMKKVADLGFGNLHEVQTTQSDRSQSETHALISIS